MIAELLRSVADDSLPVVLSIVATSLMTTLSWFFFFAGFCLGSVQPVAPTFSKESMGHHSWLTCALSLTAFWGNIATYLEPADKHYLLVKEEEVLDHIKKATGCAFRFWVLIQTLIFILVVPLFLALGLPVWELSLQPWLWLFLSILFSKRKHNLL